MKRVLTILGLLALGVSMAPAQGGGEQTLRNAVLGRSLYVRGFSADSQISWHWRAGKLVEDTPLVHTLAEFQAKSLKVRGFRVDIEGERQTLLRSTDTAFVLAPDKEKVKITVDLAGADLQTALPGLAEMLFYPGRDEALADVPEKFRGAVPAKLDQNCCHARLTDMTANCDCADTSPLCSRDGFPAGRGGLTQIRVLNYVEPEFSEEARKKKVSGNIQVGLEIDERGRPFNIWVAKGMGSGLNAKAGEAVSQYRFQPATCHGAPARTSLYIDVNFQIF